MDYTIKHDRLMKLMDKFFNNEYPEIELPLVKKKLVGKGTSRYLPYGHEYTYVNYFYYSDNDHEDPLFIEWDDNHTFSNEKWSVHEMFDKIYNFFGEEMFEDFIKWKFGLDIRKRGNKLHNWSFE